MDKCIRYAQIMSSRFSMNTNVPKDELYGRALLTLAECIAVHDPSRSSLFTYYYSRLRNDLIDFCVEWNRQIPATVVVDELPDIPCHSRVFQELSFNEAISNLTTDARRALEIFFEDEETIFGISKSCKPKHLRGAFKRHLLALEWTPTEVKSVFEEITDMVREGL